VYLLHASISCLPPMIPCPRYAQDLDLRDEKDGRKGKSTHGAGQLLAPSQSGALTIAGRFPAVCLSTQVHVCMINVCITTTKP
jgi:hypothetical protein